MILPELIEKLGSRKKINAPDCAVFWFVCKAHPPVHISGYALVDATQQTDQRTSWMVYLFFAEALTIKPPHMRGEKQVALKVNEIFYSIQGESSFAGRPCVFVRLTGCNLRCSYCDTRYAYYEGEELELSEISERISGHGCSLVEITGGEPLIQKETPALIHNLLEDGFLVLLETNGTQDISRIDERCVRIVDIKCPSSGEKEKNDPGLLTRLSGRDEIKFVLADREDYEYARGVLEDMKNNPGKSYLFLSCVWKDSPSCPGPMDTGRPSERQASSAASQDYLGAGT